MATVDPQLVTGEDQKKVEPINLSEVIFFVCRGGEKGGVPLIFRFLNCRPPLSYKPNGSPPPPHTHTL